MLFARCRFALFEGLRLLVRARDLRRVWLSGARSPVARSYAGTAHRAA
jgi:hypothetical protein